MFLAWLGQFMTWWATASAKKSSGFDFYLGDRDINWGRGETLWQAFEQFYLAMGRITRSREDVGLRIAWSINSKNTRSLRTFGVSLKVDFGKLMTDRKVRTLSNSNELLYPVTESTQHSPGSRSNSVYVALFYFWDPKRTKVRIRWVPSTITSNKLPCVSFHFSMFSLHLSSKFSRFYPA